MQRLPKYHLGEQRADAILRPLALSLAELETRAQHFLDRLQLVDEDREAVTAAPTRRSRRRAPNWTDSGRRARRCHSAAGRRTDERGRHEEAGSDHRRGGADRLVASRAVARPLQLAAPI